MVFYELLAFETLALPKMKVNERNRLWATKMLNKVTLLGI